MITREKLRTYEAYAGDMDAWGRRSRKRRADMKEEDWYLIASLLQDMRIVNNGLAADTFIDRLEDKLKLACDFAETIAVLRELSKSGI